MKNYISEIQTVLKVDSITCDVCKETFDNSFDLQEFHTVNFVGGYSSVFGDEYHIKCDICQDCLLKMIEKYYRVGTE